MGRLCFFFTTPHLSVSLCFSLTLCASVSRVFSTGMSYLCYSEDRATPCQSVRRPETVDKAENRLPGLPILPIFTRTAVGAGKMASAAPAARSRLGGPRKPPPLLRRAYARLRRATQGCASVRGTHGYARPMPSSAPPRPAACWASSRPRGRGRARLRPLGDVQYIGGDGVLSPGRGRAQHGGPPPTPRRAGHPSPGKGERP